MNSSIEKVYAREILDSRGNPTVEVDIYTKSGHLGRAAVPSGASTGEYEAIELRDMNSERYLGKGVRKALNNINSIISEAIIGLDVTKQKEVDNITATRKIGGFLVGIVTSSFHRDSASEPICIFYCANVNNSTGIGSV